MFLNFSLILYKYMYSNYGKYIQILILSSMLKYLNYCTSTCISFPASRSSCRAWSSKSTASGCSTLTSMEYNDIPDEADGEELEDELSHTTYEERRRSSKGIRRRDTPKVVGVKYDRGEWETLNFCLSKIDFWFVCILTLLIFGSGKSMIH